MDRPLCTLEVMGLLIHRHVLQWDELSGESVAAEGDGLDNCCYEVMMQSYSDGSTCFEWCD